MGENDPGGEFHCLVNKQFLNRNKEKIVTNQEDILVYRLIKFDRRNGAARECPSGDASLKLLSEK